MPDSGRTERRDAVTDAKRTIILRAAREVFEQHGLEAASMRAIAKAAGYTPGALYGYFPGKEHIYAALLHESLDRLHAAIDPVTGTAAQRFHAAGLAFYDFYRSAPKDLDLGLYLFSGGARPRGLSADLDHALNTKLLACLQPLTTAAIELGLPQPAARQATADVLAHTIGLLLLTHTKRLTLFAADPRTMMDNYLTMRIAAIDQAV